MHMLISLTALERTFLGYLRTSVTLAVMGVITAQLFRLQHSVNPNPSLGFFVLGMPLAVIFIGTAIVVLLLGAFRFWKQQNALARGKIHAGGWEINTIMGLAIVVSALLFFYLCISWQKWALSGYICFAGRYRYREGVLLGCKYAYYKVSEDMSLTIHAIML